VAKTVGLVEDVGRQSGVEYPIQGTIATSDGDSLWAFRYSSEKQSRSLFYSEDAATLRAQHPDNPVLADLADDSRLVVSEPVGDLAGMWHEVPEATCGLVHAGHDELHPFTPIPPP
jgi:glutamine amidotransferase